MIAVPPGAEVVKISPGKVTIKLERTAEATLDVHPTLRGQARAGLPRRPDRDRARERRRPRAGEPGQGQGGRDRRRPIDISGLAESTVFEADIILPRPELRFVSPADERPGHGPRRAGQGRGRKAAARKK